MGAVLNLRTAASNLLSRYAWARQMGLTFGGKRNVYEVLGYKDYGTITTADYIERYERGGIAGRIVDIMPNSTWRGELWLQEDEDPNKETPFEQAWLDLEQKFGLREKFNRVDKLSRLSTYAVLLIGAPGEFETELPKGKPEDLLYFQPFLGGGGPVGGRRAAQAGLSDADATIHEFETDMTSPRFGQAKSYMLKRMDFASPELGRPIHWSRIIHIAENRLRDDVFGQPALERPFNYLEDLDKVAGGGSEAFWMRANAGLHFNVDKDMQIAAPPPPGTANPTTQQQKAAAELEKMKADADEYQHQLTRIIRTRGVDVNQLGSDVANFAGPLDAIITLIAGCTGIPKRLLVGSEMGELASTQDRENFRDLVNGRQTNYAAPMIVRPLVDRLIAYGYLPPSKKYTVQWPTIEVLGEKEKTEGAKSWASTNQAQGEVVFTGEEIREKWAGLKPLSKEQIADIEEKAAKKFEEQQSLIKAKAGAKGDDKDDDKKAVPFGRRAARASEDEELIRVLAAAIETGADEVIEAICGKGAADA